ncbi:LysR family transcriptional regulator [Aestuariispira insulae]|uniref:DNA-binding transcriptional LysR family regulator n=1 Tax=Aestuariispira insulae TaxID=1461337 RepID=A0A3D9HE68_9PROT|nr:LysR family transcriptional regulator [Aestuariispira insulae]RED47760.1 DNA-binding transcriptional LysR family regulator [Aestuariispira insulae]
MAERLEIDGLRALLAIASQGGVTRAADHLALSQSAVSHKIKRLEQNLDCTLLARRPGGPLFTEAGLRLLEYARRMIDLHDEALAALGRKALAGTIQLGMTEDTTSSGIARILGRFTRLYPEIKVRTRISQSLTLEDWLKDAKIDIAVMQIFKRDIRPDDLVLYEDRLYWVKSHDLTLDSQKPVPFLTFDENCFYRHWALDEGSARGQRFETVLECGSAAGIRSAALSGLGIALLNGLHLTPELDLITQELPSPPEIAYVVRAHKKSRTPPVRALIGEIEREIGGTRLLLKAS